MESDTLSIGELADAAGLTRRAIRFYVQQKLIPAPTGLGRGKHYDLSHLARLKHVLQLQRAGHSLEEIRHLQQGVTVILTEAAAEPGSGAQKPTERNKNQQPNHRVPNEPTENSPANPGSLFFNPSHSRLPNEPNSTPPAGEHDATRLRAELWRRLRILEGVELSFDAARFNPTVEELLALRDAIVSVFNPSLLAINLKENAHDPDDR